MGYSELSSLGPKPSIVRLADRVTLSISLFSTAGEGLCLEAVSVESMFSDNNIFNNNNRGGSNTAGGSNAAGGGGGNGGEAPRRARRRR